MFRQRLLTTILLAPLVLALIYYANYWVLAGIVLLLILGCTFEWLQLIPIKRRVAKIIFLAAIVIASVAIQYIYLPWMFLGLIMWGIILILVYQFPKLQHLWGNHWVVGFFCLLLLPLFMQSLINTSMLKGGNELIIYLLLLVWAADIGAYLAGKQWGKHKLILSVSPGKTFEGAGGGFFLAMLVALGGFYYFQPTSLWRWFFIAIWVALISLLGDLFISMLKRRSKVKDTGQLIPGHGGLLDRLDSLIAAAPFFYCGLRFLSPGL